MIKLAFRNPKTCEFCTKAGPIFHKSQETCHKAMKNNLIMKFKTENSGMILYWYEVDEAREG